MRSPSRWDRLLEAKPIPLLEHLLEEVSKLFSETLGQWPLEVLMVDEVQGAELSALLANSPARPRDEVWHAAFALTRWDLGRDFDAYDDYMRNRRFLEKGLTEADRPMLLFLSRYLTEQMLALNEATEGRVKREHLISVLERVEKKLLMPRVLA